MGKPVCDLLPNCSWSDFACSESKCLLLRIWRTCHTEEVVTANRSVEENKHDINTANAYPLVLLKTKWCPVH